MAISIERRIHNELARLRRSRADVSPERAEELNAAGHRVINQLLDLRDAEAARNTQSQHSQASTP